jgi:hypothetical protein
MINAVMEYAAYVLHVWRGEKTDVLQFEMACLDHTEGPDTDSTPSLVKVSDAPVGDFNQQK